MKEGEKKQLGGQDSQGAEEPSPGVAAWLGTWGGAVLIACCLVHYSLLFHGFRNVVRLWSESIHPFYARGLLGMSCLVLLVQCAIMALAVRQRRVGLGLFSFLTLWFGLLMFSSIGRGGFNEHWDMLGNPLEVPKVERRYRGVVQHYPDGKGWVGIGWYRGDWWRDLVQRLPVRVPTSEEAAQIDKTKPVPGLQILSSGSILLRDVRGQAVAVHDLETAPWDGAYGPGDYQLPLGTGESRSP